LVCVFSVRTREEKGCEYRTTPARLKGTAVWSPRDVTGKSYKLLHVVSLHEPDRIERKFVY